MNNKELMLFFRAQAPRLTAGELKCFKRALMKVLDRFHRMDPTRRQALGPLRDSFSIPWNEFYQEERRREVAAAERKDRGQVLFTIFHPRKYAWEQQKVITRTPNRLIETSWITGKEPIVQVVQPEDWLRDFRRLNGVKEAA